MKRPAPQEDVESDGSESESSASAESTPQKRPRADADSATPAVDYSSASRGGDKRFAAPTHEELAELNTDRLYKSTLLAMQIRELVESQSIAYERHGLLEDTLVALRDALMSVREDKKERQVRANDVLAPGDIRVPMPSCDAEGDASEFAWRMQRPSAVHVVGSFMLRTVCAHQRNVDVLVEMPSSLFQDKDHLNHRYHRKRAYFLAELARHLHRKHATSLGHKMSFGASAYDGDVARPVLLLHQPRDQKSGRTVPFLVRIGVCAPVDTVFKASRLGPARNGVRTQAPVEPATPLYNAGLLADALWKRHMEVAHATLHDCESAREAVLLLKVWLRQRRIATDSLNGFTLTMLLVHLLRSRRVSALMSSYQLFRVVLETLAGDLLLTAAPSMCPDTPETTEETRNTANPLPSRAEFKRAFPVILIDPTGRINLLAHLTATAFDNVRHEARMSTEVLDAPASTVSVDAYTALFATPLTTAAKADYSLWLTRLPPVAASLVPLVSPAATVERPFDWPVHVANTIASLLRRAFTDRARVVYVEPRAPQVWSLTDAPTLPTVRAARVNVVLHPTASRRQLDRAPPSTVLEDQEREHTSHTQTPFRLLWASKVQLHQFSDGTLGDAVLWEMTASTRHLVVHRMATFLLTHHLGIAPSRVASTVDAYDTLLRAPHPTTTATSDGTANDLALLNDTLAPTAFSHAVRALEDLEKLLRNMGSSLPLRVASLQGASPHLSHTAVFPPPVYDVASFSSLSTSARYAPAISLVLRFESSSRWPDKVAAIERIKAAFLVRIASELDARHGIKAHVRAPPSSDDDDDADAEDAFGADHPDPSHAPTLDICYRGLLFRVAIHHPRELLLRRAGCELTPAIMLRLAQLDTPDAASATSATAGVYVSALRPDAPDGGAAVAAAVAASAPMRAQHVRTLATRVVFRPAHTTLIYSLSTRFPAFSGAVRLAKRWISAQMLSPYFTGEALELLVAAVFVSPWPYAVPATASAAFLRFLDLLTSHDWAAEPLVVNIDAALTPEAHAHASLAFSKAARDTLPALVLITAQDPTGCRWTHPHPSPTVLRRTLDLAVAAVDSLAAAQSSDHIRRVFIAPLAEYDALLSLRPDILPRAHQAILPHSATSTSTATTSTTTIAPTAKGATDSFKNLSSGLAGPPLPLYDHNVASVILNQLQCMFGEFAMFFYDACGGGHVGVAWREPAMAQHPFKVSRARYMRSALRSSEDRSSSSSKASSKTITVVPNLDHLLAAMREVARGCIQE